MGPGLPLTSFGCVGGDTAVPIRGVAKPSTRCSRPPAARPLGTHTHASAEPGVRTFGPRTDRGRSPPEDRTTNNQWVALEVYGVAAGTHCLPFNLVQAHSPPGSASSDRPCPSLGTPMRGPCSLTRPPCRSGRQPQQSLPRKSPAACCLSTQSRTSQPLPRFHGSVRSSAEGSASHPRANLRGRP